MIVSSSARCDLMPCKNCRQMAHCLPFSRNAAVVPRKTGPNSKLRSRASCRRPAAVAHFDCLPQALHKPVLVTMLISKPAAVRKRTSANCKACSHLLPRPSAETKALQNALAASLPMRNSWALHQRVHSRAKCPGCYILSNRHNDMASYCTTGTVKLQRPHGHLPVAAQRVPERLYPSGSGDPGWRSVLSLP